MARIMVRVKEDQRLREDGGTWLPGQTLWISPERLRDIADQVEVVAGVEEPKVRTTAMDSPKLPVDSGSFPQPDVRLLQPRGAPIVTSAVEEKHEEEVDQDKVKKPKVKPTKKPPVGYSKKK